MYCRNCGKEIPESVNFCYSCGAKVVDEHNNSGNGCTSTTVNADPVSVVNSGKKRKQKIPFYKNVWFWIAAVAVFILLVSGPAESSNSNVGTDPTQNSTDPKDDVIEISPEELYKAYDENEISADMRYKDKTVKITGIIDSIGKDIVDDVYITLDTGEIFGSIQCYFLDSNQIEKVATLKSGDTVTVIGTCDGFLITVSVKDCVIE